MVNKLSRLKCKFLNDKVTKGISNISNIQEELRRHSAELLNILRQKY